MTANRLRLAALLLAFIPALLYGTGLVVTLNTSGGLGALLILILLVPLVGLTIVAWRQPRWGGDGLAAASCVLALAFLIVLGGRYPVRELATAGVIMFGLPILASVLFRASARQNGSVAGRRQPKRT